MENKKQFASKYRKTMYVLIFVLLSATSFFIYYQIAKSHQLFLKYKYNTLSMSGNRNDFSADYCAYIQISVSLIVFFLVISYVLIKILFMPLEKFRNNFEKIVSSQRKLFPQNISMNDFSSISAVIDEMAKRYNDLTGLNQYHQNILENMNDALVVVNTDGGVIFANHSASDLLGYSSEELLSFNFNQIILEKSGANVFQKDVLNKTDFQVFFEEYRFVCKCKNSKMIPVDISVSAINNRDDGIQSVICVLKDVTRERRVEDHMRLINEQLQENQQQLRIANEELKLTLKISESLREDLSMSTKHAEALAKVKSEFLANMSHEIRTPMTAIIGFSNLLKRTSMGEIQLSYLNSIISSGNLLIAIINDILDVSKIEAGKIVLEQVDFNLHYLLNDVFRMIITRIEDSMIDTYIDISKDVPVFLRGDPTRLKQVLINLLGNATKFTAKGSIGVIVSLEKNIDHDKDIALQFIVRDTGIGMSKEETQSIFDAFSQADSSITREYGGTGLGLTICKSMIEIMGGRISVKSDKTKGSDFIFSIPLALAQDENKLREEDQLEFLKGVNVMIIDDNIVSGRIHKKLCESMGMTVISMEESSLSALDALEKFNEEGNLPQIILTDLLMDGMDGYALTREIRNLDFCDGVKIVAVTVVPKIKNEQDVGEDFDGYLLKPVTFSDLSKLLIRLVKNLPANHDDFIEIEDDFSLFKGIKVLVVDDSSTNQLLMDACLKEFGCQGDFANHGKEAIDILKENLDYDMIFMDLQMPVLDGIEASKQIRQEISDDIPIIALTADILKVKDGHYKEYQMDDFILKPFDLARLKEVLLKYRRYA